jgi:hypothetical protein
MISTRNALAASRPLGCEASSAPQSLATHVSARESAQGSIFDLCRAPVRRACAYFGPAPLRVSVLALMRQVASAIPYLLPICISHAPTSASAREPQEAQKKRVVETIELFAEFLTVVELDLRIDFLDLSTVHFASMDGAARFELGSTRVDKRSQHLGFQAPPPKEPNADWYFRSAVQLRQSKNPNKDSVYYLGRDHSTQVVPTGVTMDRGLVAQRYFALAADAYRSLANIRELSDEERRNWSQALDRLGLYEDAARALEGEFLGTGQYPSMLEKMLLYDAVFNDKEPGGKKARKFMVSLLEEPDLLDRNLAPFRTSPTAAEVRADLDAGNTDRLLEFLRATLLDAQWRLMDGEKWLQSTPTRSDSPSTASNGFPVIRATRAALAEAIDTQTMVNLERFDSKLTELASAGLSADWPRFLIGFIIANDQDFLTRATSLLDCSTEELQEFLASRPTASSAKNGKSPSLAELFSALTDTALFRQTPLLIQASLLTGIGMDCLENGDITSARFHFENAQMLCPDSHSARLGLGLVLFMADPEDERAVRYFESVSQAPIVQPRIEAAAHCALILGDWARNNLFTGYERAHLAFNDACPGAAAVGALRALLGLALAREGHAVHVDPIDDALASIRRLGVADPVMKWMGDDQRKQLIRRLAIESRELHRKMTDPEIRATIEWSRRDAEIAGVLYYMNGTPDATRDYLRSLDTLAELGPLNGQNLYDAIDLRMYLARSGLIQRRAWESFLLEAERASDGRDPLVLDRMLLCLGTNEDFFAGSAAQAISRLTSITDLAIKTFGTSARVPRMPGIENTLERLIEEVYSRPRDFAPDALDSLRSIVVYQAGHINIFPHGRFTAAKVLLHPEIGSKETWDLGIEYLESHDQSTHQSASGPRPEARTDWFERLAQTLERYGQEATAIRLRQQRIGFEESAFPEPYAALASEILRPLLSFTNLLDTILEELSRVSSVK